jgi:hypothetical protein
MKIRSTDLELLHSARQTQRSEQMHFSEFPLQTCQKKNNYHNPISFERTP